ncbi:DUF4013 domain-containing protein [Candidatus Woesearchaeota archaeon]|nr:DUF4013 domain-containing protein [Candidatus Woesearchaeota archaeon]
MVNYGAAFKLPFSNWGRIGIFFLLALFTSAVSEVFSMFGELGRRAPAALGVQHVLLIIFLAVVTLFFSLATTGYTLRIVGNASQGKNVLPSFEKFFSMAMLGLKYFLAMVIYAIPFLAVGGIAFVFLFAGGSVGGAMLLIPVILIWVLFAVYILPMLMAHFAHEGRFSAFFELRKVLKYAFTTAYFVPWLAAFGYGIALFILYFIIILPVSLISLVTPLAALLTAPVSALYTVILTPTVMSLYGQAYHDVTAGGKKGKK